MRLLQPDPDGTCCACGMRALPCDTCGGTPAEVTFNDGGTPAQINAVFNSDWSADLGAPGPTTGAVNGVPVTTDVQTAGSDLVTIPYFPAGTDSTLDVETDGSGLHSPNSRVAFIGGSEAGRDHFPWPVLDILGLTSGPFGNHSTYPYSLSADVALQWAMIARKWHLNCDIGYSSDVGAGVVANTASFSFDFEPKIWNGSSFVAPASVADLLLLIRNPANFDLGDLRTIDGDKTGSTGVVGATVSDYSFSNSEPALDDYIAFHLIFSFKGWWESSEIRFPIGLSVDVFDQTARTYSNGSGSYPDLVNEDKFQMGFQDDTEYQAGVYSTHSTLTEPGNPDFSAVKIDSVEINIGGVEFWGYANSSGDQVYDTSTGAPLVNPLS